MPKSEFDGIVPERLSLELRRGRCVLFAGAGLSMQARRVDGTTLPAWGKLLSDIYHRAVEMGRSLPSDIPTSIGRGALLEAGQELQGHLSPNDLAYVIRDIFQESTLALSSAHIVIPKMRWRAVLTTNYDELLERAYAASGIQCPEVLTFEDYLGRRRDPLRNRDCFIFKIHGDLKQPRSIALGTRSYQDLIHWNPGYRFLLESILNTFTVVFVGFGGSDPDINHVLDALASRFRRRDDRHYILMPRGKWSTVEKRRNELDRALETIEYDDRDGHVQVSRFLQELALHRSVSQRPLVTYCSRSLLGKSLCAAVEDLGSDVLDMDTFNAAGWFDDARARLEVSDLLVLTTSAEGIEERILRSLADQLAVPVLSVVCDTTAAGGESSPVWSARIAEAVRNARPHASA